MEITREVEIHNIRRFGRYARVACLLLALSLTILGTWWLGNIVFGPAASGYKVSLGAYDVFADQIVALPLKAWALVMAAIFLGIMFSGLYQLYRLFGNLAAGSIYTKGNVLHIRRLGLLALTVAVMQIVLPMVSQLLLSTGIIDETSVTPVAHGVGPDSLSMFIMAGLILLASWIMEVGRQTSEEAQQLRREGELVI